MSKKGKNSNDDLLAIERQRLQVEFKRLEIERARASGERSFWSRHSGSIVAALISAAITAGGLIYVSQVNWKREDFFSSQRKDDLARSEQRNVEYRVSEETQQKREWELKMAQFILDNQKILFKGTPEEQKLLAQVIPTTFPQEVSVVLFERLERTGTLKARVIWREARAKVQDKQPVESKEPTPIKTDIRDVVPPRTLLGSYSSTYMQEALTDKSILSFPSYRSGNTDPDFMSKYLANVNAKPTGFTDVIYQPITASFVSGPSKSSLDLQSPVKDLSSIVFQQPPRDLLLVSTSPPPKWNVEISGTVVDAQTGLPIPDAQITLESSSLLLPELIGLQTAQVVFDLPRNISLIFILRPLSGSGSRARVMLRRRKRQSRWAPFQLP